MVAVVAVVAVGALALALRLEPSAATDTLTGRSSEQFRATERLHRAFGDEPILVLVHGRLTDLLLTPDLGRILRLEGCISGNVPRGAEPPGPACAGFARLRPVRVVYGPGTFINESARQIASRFETQRSERAAQAKRAARAARELAKAQGRSEAEQGRLASRARQLVYAQFARDALALALRYGLTSPPALNNPEFILRLVFEPRLGAGVPKPRFAHIFPSADSALIQARLRPGLAASERRRAIELVREAVAEPRFRLERGSYVVSGEPVVAEGVESSITGALAVLGVAALVLVAGTLALVFRSRPRLLGLAPAVAAAALTFGAASLAGTSLTIATIAVLPLLVGLAAGYEIQIQASFNEARAGSAPVVATAGLVTVAGLGALLLSPLPMVRSFGAMLAAGVVLSLACMLTAGLALLGGELRLPGAGVLRRGARVLARSPVAGVLRRGARVLARSPTVGVRRGARVLARNVAPRLRLRRLGAGPRTAPPARAAVKLHAATRAVALVQKGWTGAVALTRRVSRRLLEAAIGRPRKVLAIAIALAIVGWALDTRTAVVSDLQRLGPGGLREIEDLRTLREETGVSGDVDVVVRAADLADPDVIAWMSDYRRRVLARHGYRQGRPCRRARLCPALSATDLLGSGRRERSEQVRTQLDALPRYFSRAVITPDRRTAVIGFGVRVMPPDQRRELVDDMRAQLDPPSGVQAELAGPGVLAAKASSELDSSRRVLTAAALVAAFLVLLAIYRRRERALVPLIPVALATGWSALVLFLIRIPLNPLSAALGALVVAIAAGLGVLLSARYHQERGLGLAPAAALERAFRGSGAAVAASAATTIAGFGALIASDVRMLREFGVAGVVDLAVVLAGVAVVLPAALVWAEERGPLRLPRSRAGAARRRLRAR